MKTSDSVKKLPASALKLIDQYQNLHIQGLVIACPYHINSGLRSKNRALVGKGRPEEIEAVAERYLSKFQMHADGDQQTLFIYMLASGHGVDCSGFAAWVLDCLTKKKLNKRIWQCLVFPGVKRRLISKLRPIENISANLLTSPLNSRKIDDLNDIRPGDLIRLIDGGHVMVVSEVGLDKDGVVNRFEYVQSTTTYGSKRGVESGTVKVTRPGAYLLDQLWKDNLIYKALKDSGDDARLVRLHALA
jgi:hypothetical protein